MDIWARAKEQDRAALFTQTAATKGISPEIAEKDFWVCWILRQVFELQDLPRIIFKGGTSLSKAFGIIARFSEDVDLVINRHELGFENDNDPAKQERTNLRNRTIEYLRKKCTDVIIGDFIPKLRRQIQAVIGEHGWTLTIDPNIHDADTVLFQYPLGISDSITPQYIKRVVRLELGCRGEQVPSEDATVTPYAADAFPNQFESPSVQVKVISPERTFWEKVTILHREYYRSEAGKAVSERIFRHYHDVVVIAQHERGREALKNIGLLDEVVSHKQHLFREGQARYELARKGTLRLAPSVTLEKELRKDYEKMREMYFGAHPEFDDVMKAVRNLEESINGS